MLVTPSPNVPIVKETGEPEAHFNLFLQAVSRLDIIIGTGSPEGVVEALQGQEYMDETGVTGAIKYIKRDSDIAGDKTKGWILV